MANFPTSLPNANPTADDVNDADDDLAGTGGSLYNHATEHGRLTEEVRAVATKVGVDSSAVTTSIDYKINNLGGDLSGTLPNPSVVDDSHAHTTTTISGLDAADVSTGTFAQARIASGTASAGTAPVSDGLGGTAWTDVATQAELNAHESDTTSVHGITDTSTLYRASGTDVAVADGGTGASTAADARTNLGVAIGSDVQAYDADLADLASRWAAAAATTAASLAFRERTDSGTNQITVKPADSAIASDKTLTLPDATDTLVGKATTDTLTNKTIALGSNTVSGSTAEFNTANTDANFYTTSGTDVAVADGGTGASTAADARTNLGVAIGTDVQAWDAALDDFAGLTQATDKLPYFDSATTMAAADFTAFGRSLVDDANAAAGRTTLSALGFGEVDVDIQSFTASGTYTKPSNALAVFYHLVGGGGQGGGGRRAAGAGEIREGGCGGGSGGVVFGWMDAAEVGATETVTVAGTASAAGGGGGSDGTNGTAGTAGGSTSFGSHAEASGGGGGAGGTNANDVTPTSGATITLPFTTFFTLGSVNVFCTATGGAHVTDATGGAGTAGGSGAVGQTPGGGGGGGGFNNTDTARAGAAGGPGYPGAQSGGALGGVNANGSPGTSASDLFKHGAGGGGGGRGTVGAAGNGGAGGTPGGGGGGGGGSNAGITAGNGGAGGRGEAIVVTLVARTA